MAWTAERQLAFASRCHQLAVALRQAEDMADDIFEIWFANAVSGEETFQNTGALTEQDMTDAVTLADHFRAFLRNGAVATADRSAVLARIAGGPLGV
jgi:hypothetical protein